MNNWVVLPIVMPIISGMIMVIFKNNIRLHRFLSLLTLGLIGIVSVLLLEQIETGGIQTLYLGGWQAPFGITLVADMFAVLLVLVGAIVTFCCLCYAFYSIGKDREKHYF